MQTQCFTLRTYSYNKRENKSSGTIPVTICIYKRHDFNLVYEYNLGKPCFTVLGHEYMRKKC